MNFRDLGFAAGHPRIHRLIQRVRARDLTYLSHEALRELAQAVLSAPPGDLVEAGVALGGSSIVMAGAKSPATTLRLFDTFGMIPAPSANDGPDAHRRYREISAGSSQGIGGQDYYGYRSDLISEVEANLVGFGFGLEQSAIKLIPGMFAEVLHVRRPVALAHVDCDWYESVLTVLKRLAPFISVGGRFIVDDYATWSGARRAVDEFFDGTPEWRFERRARLHVVRV